MQSTTGKNTKYTTVYKPMQFNIYATVQLKSKLTKQLSWPENTLKNKMATNNTKRARTGPN